MKENVRVMYVAQKWWKVWYARPLTDNEKHEFERDVFEYDIDRNDVMIAMMKIRNNMFD